jgi:hypothetical protein
MSDNYIVLVPVDPRFVPAAEKQQVARKRFAEIAPDVELIDLKVSPNFQFFDCGENFERVSCPSCGAQLDEDWWQDRMEEDIEGEGTEVHFRLAAYPTHCCGTQCNLNELQYDWPQRFGRFALDAMNPNIGELKDEHKREFEKILGTPLIVVYQHT